MFDHFLQCLLMPALVVVDRCAPAATMLQTNGDLKRKWTWAVYWLNDELERVRERERDSVSVGEGVCVREGACVPSAPSC